MDISNTQEEIVKAERAAREKEIREAETKAILKQLKSIPASEYELNKQLYQQLVNYNPENKQFKQKLSFYSQKLKEQQEKARARKAKFGEPPIQSAWDGSYSVVESYLEKIANDPDSIDVAGCTKVYHTKNGWLVGCDYRGRNAFGGIVKQSNWFTIVHNRVVQMHDASAYKP